MNRCLCIHLGFLLEATKKWTPAKFTREKERGRGGERRRETERRIYLKSCADLQRDKRKEKLDFRKERNTSVLRNERPRVIAVLSAPAMNQHSVFQLCITPFKFQLPRELIPFVFTWLPIPTSPVSQERTEHLQYSSDRRNRQFIMKIQDTIARKDNGS